VAVKHTAVQVSRLSYLEQLIIGHDLLYCAWTDRGPCTVRSLDEETAF
jgi:hypothetical protein